MYLPDRNRPWWTDPTLVLVLLWGLSMAGFVVVVVGCVVGVFPDWVCR